MCWVSKPCFLSFSTQDHAESSRKFIKNSIVKPMLLYVTHFAKNSTFFLRFQCHMALIRSALESASCVSNAKSTVGIPPLGDDFNYIYRCCYLNSNPPHFSKSCLLFFLKEVILSFFSFWLHPSFVRNVIVFSSISKGS